MVTLLSLPVTEVSGLLLLSAFAQVTLLPLPTSTIRPTVAAVT